MKDFRIALCQTTPVCDDVRANISRVTSMVVEAARGGAKFLVLPELFYHPFDLGRIASAQCVEKEVIAGFCGLCREHDIYLCAGSMVEERNGSRFNTSRLVGPDGKVLLSYSKCHLFDSKIDHASCVESGFFTPGDSFDVVDTMYARAGIAICYDIRFPEMAREAALRGAELLALPAVFSSATGPLHWRCFLQTRAVENQIFVAAANQGASPDTSSRYRAYGHSMVVSPWGEVLAEGGEGECIVYADVTQRMMAEAREKLPLLQHRRGRLYTSFERERSLQYDRKVRASRGDSGNSVF